MVFGLVDIDPEDLGKLGRGDDDGGGVGEAVHHGVGEQVDDQAEPEQSDGELEQLEGEQLAALRVVKGRPASISYFEDVLTSSKREEEIRASNSPVVGVYCNFAPEELIHAAGAVPVRTGRPPDAPA